MAPTPKSHLSTPSSKSHHSRTPSSKRLNFTKETAAAAAAPPQDHPVEVVGRIRNHPETKNKLATNSIASALQINTDEKSLKVKTEIGYRDFSLDGVSSSEQDDLDEFYEKFVQSRINGVKMGNKCTIMMYGPTGSGKSHTMFGCVKQPGIVYKALKDILGEVEEGDGVGMFVQVTVLEIYNEEIYDLLSNVSNGGGGFSLGWSKGGSTSKVRLEVMGKKAKNATFISGNEAGKILKEIQKVEKRRIVKSTLCNERSSRSHCMIILDVPTVGGQLLLVDMAGSENIEQAGQSGFEAKMQTGKINQGNIALKRVVESIANGDSHVPFRDSKLTMLLQDSFEDDKSKILMILCASPDPKELHKTIATLEYGAKAKCIVRGPHTPIKEKGGEDSSQAVILGSRIAALDQFIRKLQVENKLKEKECEEAQKKLKNKEEEVSALRAKLAMVEKRGTEEDVNLRVSEILKIELERVKECEKMANEIVEMEKWKMEENMAQKQREVEMLRRRLDETESEIRVLKGETTKEEMEECNGFMNRLLEVCYEDSDMVKSMDLDKSIDMETSVVVRGSPATSAYSYMNNFRESVQDYPGKACLTTVFEEEEIESDETENFSDEEVQKEVIEEKMIIDVEECGPNNASSREMMIQNILTICGASEIVGHDPNKIGEKEVEKLEISDEVENDLKENQKPFEEICGDIEVYVKWEASKENSGKFITTLKVLKESTFTFIVLGDPWGAPVAKEKEGTTETVKLPVCNNKVHGRLVCLRPLKPIQGAIYLSREQVARHSNCCQFWF